MKNLSGSHDLWSNNVLFMLGVYLSGQLRTMDLMEDTKQTGTNASEESEKKPSTDKNMDRDGGERQPTDQKQEPSK